MNVAPTDVCSEAVVAGPGPPSVCTPGATRSRRNRHWSALHRPAFARPADVSVAGFDDIATLRDLSPALTTVRLPLEDMGVRAAQMTFVDDESEAPRVARVRGEVILRESTAAPPPST